MQRFSFAEHPVVIDQAGNDEQRLIINEGSFFAFNGDLFPGTLFYATDDLRIDVKAF